MELGNIGSMVLSITLMAQGWKREDRERQLVAITLLAHRLFFEIAQKLFQKRAPTAKFIACYELFALTPLLLFAKTLQLSPKKCALLQLSVSVITHTLDSIATRLPTKKRVQDPYTSLKSIYEQYKNLIPYRSAEADAPDLSLLKRDGEGAPLKRSFQILFHPDIYPEAYKPFAEAALKELCKEVDELVKNHFLR